MMASGMGDQAHGTVASQLYSNEAAASEMTTSEKVVELLNQAALISTEEKLVVLKQVQELIINKDPSLLDNFLDEIIAFQTDKSIEVRKFVIGFIEEACKRDNELLLRLIANLNMLMRDDSVNVVKKAILTLTQLYKVALQWLVRTKSVSEMQEACWDMVTQMKEDVLALLDSDNDGVRTHAIKFTESLIISLSPRTPDSDTPKKQEGDISLDKIPKDHAYIRYDTLCEEGKSALEQLLKFMVHPAISSINLTTALGSLATLARQRPMFMSEVVQAYETLHANLPPTLAKSQVSSVRKNLKLHLVAVLKHPSSVDFQGQISTLLLDLGMSQSEITRCTPATVQPRKRLHHEPYVEGKRIKMEGALVEDDEDKEEPAPVVTPKPSSSVGTQSAIDLTAEFLLPLLSPENVANLVLISMVYLPEVMPASFQATYTPVESAGTDAQIKHLARLMATQMTGAGLGPGLELCKARDEEVKEEEGGAAESSSKDPLIIRKLSAVSLGQAISVVGAVAAYKSPIAEEAPQIKKLPEPILPTTQAKALGASGRKKVFKLADVVQPFSEAQIEKLTNMAITRILQSEKTIAQSGMSHVRVKLLARLVTQFEGGKKNDLLQFILEDMRSRSELAFSLLYHEYNEYLSQQPSGSLDSYEQCLFTLLSGLQEKPEQRDGLFTKLVLEAPVITDSALEVIRLMKEKLLVKRLTSKMFIKEESEDIKMAFIKEESEDMKIEEVFIVKHEDTEEQTDVMSLKEEREVLNAEKPGEKSFKCSQTEKTISDFTCIHCGKSFSQQRNLKVHMRVHTREKPNGSPQCGKSLIQDGNLKVHMRVHAGGKAYTCPQCGKSFDRHGNLKVHMRVHTGEKPHTCPQCGKSFNEKGNLNVHMRVHTGENPYTCLQCGKTFKQHGNFTVHMRVHTGEKPYTCLQCGKSFDRHGNLKSHIRVHTGEKPYTCLQCGRSFEQHGTLKVHMRVHTGDKPYTCLQCGKSFARRGTLKVHMRLHTGEKPYTCTNCGKSFTQKKHLEIHMRTHSRENF